MKRFICWYAYKGQETEGHLQLEEPQIIEANDLHEAMWKWHNNRNPKFTEFYKDLEDFRKRNPEPQGWGMWCEELADKKI